jgi:uncharacterized DUF497 family protein
LKLLNWNTEKNELLKKERNISFEDVVFEILNDNILETNFHPNQEQYPNQKIYTIKINSYVYLVPFVETETEIFLKTIIPSRKETKKFKQNENQK